VQILTIHRHPRPRGDDFCWGVEGEVAVPGLVCDAPNCGCDRSHIGLNSHKGSTTVQVSNTELTVAVADVEAAVDGYMEAAGWGPIPAGEVAILVEGVIEAAARFPVGTVLRPAFNRDTDTWTYTPVGAA
jgi:hypothetical protein